MSQERKRARLRIYAAGGCGTNIGSRMERSRNSTELTFAELDIGYIDTSLSNLNGNVDRKHCYLFEGLDGSAKIRAMNHSEIAPRVRDILQQLPPGDINVVLHSTAGGSGSVIGPEIASELLARDLPTIVIAVGSSDTRQDADNTIKTIRSYEAIASRVREVPVVMAYIQNGKFGKGTRGEVDVQIERLVSTLASLFSNQNKELDSADLAAWLRYDRIPGQVIRPQLVSLLVYNSSDEWTGVGNVITVASLFGPNQEPRLPRVVDSHYYGFLPDGEDGRPLNEQILTNVPMHFLICDGPISDVATDLAKFIKDTSQAGAAVVHRKSILSENDKPTDSGLVL